MAVAVADGFHECCSLVRRVARRGFQCVCLGVSAAIAVLVKFIRHAGMPLRAVERMLACPMEGKSVYRAQRCALQGRGRQVGVADECQHGVSTAVCRDAARHADSRQALPKSPCLPRGSMRRRLSSRIASARPGEIHRARGGAWLFGGSGGVGVFGVVLHGFAWFRMVSHGFAWFRTVSHDFGRFRAISGVWSRGGSALFLLVLRAETICGAGHISLIVDYAAGFRIV